jgi:four helix bundle protein
MGKGYEDLEVYRRAFALQRPIYDLVARFPDFEKYDLASQMRRACKSVASNIVEGYARQRSPKELCSYLAISVGSANEMHGHLKTAHALGYISDEELKEYCDAYQVVARQLTKLIQFWRTRN